MELRTLAAAIPDAQVLGDGSVEVGSLAYDSRRAREGGLFFCVPGEKADGHEFAESAVDAGAVALLGERRLDQLEVPQILVPDARAAMAPLAARFYEDPTARLKVIGVTGTNGKTTTAFLIWQILRSAGFRCGLLGTVQHVVGGRDRPAERTTPESVDLQAIFREMLESGDEVCVMEVSSHALDLKRVDAIHFDIALFTNLTQDHLDFHGDMEEYFRAKSRLFAMRPRISIVNVDDPYGARLAGTLENCETFSAGGGAADFAARDVAFDASSSSFRVNAWSARLQTALPGGLAVDEAQEVHTSLPGHFNVANALAAFVAARALEIGSHEAAELLAEAQPPPGRIEPVEEGQPFAVLVDYAHTPDSLENVLTAVRKMTENRVIAVFGAGGDRDRSKRPKMGEAAARLADHVFVTSDNPRSEDPQSIVAEVRSGIGDDSGVETVTDRRSAIAAALGLARPGDTVLIAGKGHEQGQEFEQGRKVPFDDRKVAREELRELLSREGTRAPESG